MQRNRLAFDLKANILYHADLPHQRNIMEDLNPETEQTPVVLINGVEYNSAAATQETSEVIQDISTVQNRMNVIKADYDIMGIARQALLAKVSLSIEDGTSGLQAIEETVPDAETPAEVV